MVDRICEWCKKEFSTKKKNQRFCCKDCKSKSQITDNKKICPVCWEKFKPHNNGTVFCSRECYGISKRKDKTKVCPICWVEFQQKHYNQIYCSTSCSSKTKVHFMWEYTIPWKESGPNKYFWRLLSQIGFDVDCTEFCLDGYYFDFKIWNILLELNPYPYHNSTRAPKMAVPKDKYYHYNKYRHAIDNWYRCIMVWDWTTNLIDMMKDDNFHYEWLPQLHYYNPKTKEHTTRKNRNKSRIDKWFVEIRDCGKETF